MNCSRRDSGAIHMMFFVVVLVVGLAGWGLWYSQYTENEANVAAKQLAEADSEVAQQSVTLVRMAYDDLAKKVGGVPSIKEPTGETMETWRDKYLASHRPVTEKRDGEVKFFQGNLSTSPDLISAFAPAEALVKERESEIERLKNELTQAKSETGAMRSSKDDADSQHRTELQTRADESQQLRTRLNSQLSGAEASYTKTLEQFNEASSAYAKDLESKNVELRNMQDKMEANDREVTILKSHLVTKRAWETPDGQVIEVDHKTGRAWIDLGSRHWLRHGTRFKVFGVKKGGVREHHGYVVVHDVEPRRALCAIERGDEMKPGDLLVNPHFNRGQKARFFFLGKLPGRFDNQTAQRILESFDGSVDPEMSIHVDFLVLGDNPDPTKVGEDAEPNWFKKTSEYTDALRWGIETIRARDLATFLQY